MPVFSLDHYASILLTALEFSLNSSIQPGSAVNSIICQLQNILQKKITSKASSWSLPTRLSPREHPARSRRNRRPRTKYSTIPTIPSLVTLWLWLANQIPIYSHSIPNYRSGPITARVYADSPLYSRHSGEVNVPRFRSHPGQLSSISEGQP